MKSFFTNVKINGDEYSVSPQNAATLAKMFYWGKKQSLPIIGETSSMFCDEVERWICPAKSVPASKNFDILKEMMFAATNPHKSIAMCGVLVGFEKERGNRIFATTDGRRLLVRKNIPDDLYESIRIEYGRLCCGGKQVENGEAILMPASVAEKLLSRKLCPPGRDEFSEPFNINGVQYQFCLKRCFPDFRKLRGRVRNCVPLVGGMEFYNRRTLLYAAQNLYAWMPEPPTIMEDDGMSWAFNINFMADFFRMIDRAGEKPQRWSANVPSAKTEVELDTENYEYLVMPMHGGNVGFKPQKCRFAKHGGLGPKAIVGGKEVFLNPAYDYFLEPPTEDDGWIKTKHADAAPDVHAVEVAEVKPEPAPVPEAIEVAEVVAEVHPEPPKSAPEEKPSFEDTLKKRIQEVTGASDDWAKKHLVVTTIPAPKPKAEAPKAEPPKPEVPKAEAAKADAPAPQKPTEGKRHYTYTKPRAFGEWQVKGELAMNAKGQVTVDGCRVGVQGSPEVEFSEGMELPPKMGEALAAKYWGKVKAYLDKNPAENEAVFLDGYRMIAERDPALLAAAVDYRVNQPLRWLFAAVTGLSLTFIRAYDEKVIRLWLGENAEGVELEKRKPGRKPKAEVETNNKGEANDRMGVRGDGRPRGVHGDAVVAAAVAD